MGVGEAIGGIAEGAGDVAAANAQANASEQQTQLQRDQFAAHNAAYDYSVGQGAGQYFNASNAINAEANTANPELTSMSADVANRNAQQLQQGAQQMGANLSTQGVRGGQAATLLNRGSGQQATEMQQYLDQLKYQDSASKQQQLMAYNAAIGQGGQKAELNTSF